MTQAISQKRNSKSEGIPKGGVHENHPDTLVSKNDLAVLCMQQARYDEAEPLILQAVEGRRLKLGDGHPHTLESLNTLIELYEAWGKLGEAVKWRKKLPPMENPDF